MAKEYYEGIGRRKTSTARVRIYKGKNPSTINDKPVDVYFALSKLTSQVYLPLAVAGQEGAVYFTAKSTGGGTTGQAEAVALGIARALFAMDPALKTELRKHGLTTRDPRMVERKKYDHVKARKKAQFSKR